MYSLNPLTLDNGKHLNQTVSNIKKDKEKSTLKLIKPNSGL